jgi:hypothetical protein
VILPGASFFCPRPTVGIAAFPPQIIKKTSANGLPTRRTVKDEKTSRRASD